MATGSRLGRRINLLWRHLGSSTSRFERTHEGLSSPRCLFLLRPFSSASPEDDLHLLDSLRTQIRHEAQVSSLQDLQSPPKPFKLIDKPNAHEVFLQRSFGVEDIEISCVYHDQTYGDNDGEEGFDPPPNVPMKMVQMTIKISVGSNQPFLEIVCCNFGEKSSIEQVLLKDHVVNLKEAPYEGPDISMLTDKVKSGFVQYLEARGIDNELGKFLLSFMPQRAQQKYSHWLAKIEGFVKS